MRGHATPAPRRVLVIKRETPLNTRTVTMIVGLILALGMGGLLVALLDNDSGADIVALLFMFGVIAGIVVVVAGALSRSDDD